MYVHPVYHHAHIHYYTLYSDINALEFHADAPPPPSQEPSSLLFKNPFIYLDGGPA